MRIRIVDAFADRPFAGNPAGVCLLDVGPWPDKAWMRQVAAELSCETAFARLLPEGADADWALRWFTPAAESNVCGHATLATAHALHTDRGTPLTIRLASHFGLLIAGTRHDAPSPWTSPRRVLSGHRSPTASPRRSALGAKPDATYRTGVLGYLLAVMGDEAAVRALQPDFTVLARLTRRDGIRGIIATAVSADGDCGYDFVSRSFAPAGGIAEDPVTGSAHTALAPYWSQRLGRDSLTGLQASARTGLVRTAIAGDRVHLTGRAVTVPTVRL